MSSGAVGLRGEGLLGMGNSGSRSVKGEEGVAQEGVRRRGTSPGESEHLGSLAWDPLIWLSLGYSPTPPPAVRAWRSLSSNRRSPAASRPSN